MALPLAEPAAIAALRAEAAGGGNAQLALVSGAIGALWAEISGIHSQSEQAHAALNDPQSESFWSLMGSLCN